MSFPYQDLAAFKLRTPMPSGDVDAVEAIQPGFTVRRLAAWQSYINGRLRKRYGNGDPGSSLPLGQSAPPLVASGTNPPAITLQGRPQLGSLQVQIKITTPGALGAASGSYSLDNGITLSPFTTAASLVLGLGITAVFSPGPYSADNVYQSDTAVPDIVLNWQMALTTVDMYRKRGVNPQDPVIEMIREDAQRALNELKEAADSKDGLFDLPTNDDGDSAVTTGGPMGYSEASPYTWTTLERNAGRAEDEVETIPVSQTGSGGIVD